MFHFNYLQAEVKASLGFLEYNKAPFTLSAYHTLVKMAILLIFDYGGVTYKITSKLALNRLDVLHYSAIYFASAFFHLPSFYSTRENTSVLP